MTSAHRQQPGIACEGCRKKKTRCNRVRPVCGSCFTNNVECVYMKSCPKRGPKKGQLQALRARVATLEHCLIERSSMDGEFSEPRELGTVDTTRIVGARQLLHEENDSLDHFLFSDVLSHIDGNNLYPDRNLDSLDRLVSSSFLSPPSDEDVLARTKGPETGKELGENRVSCNESLTELDLELASASSPTFIPTPLTAATIPASVMPSQRLPNVTYIPETASHDTATHMLGDTEDWVQADLDQLYFDRVHALMPLIHRTWYFTWARKPNKPDACAVLQSAMRTLAAGASTSFQQLSKLLYADTRQTLEKLDDANEQDPIGSVPLEHIQAWLLLAHYEFTHKPYHRAMMTAGHAFRMVQVALLHQVDACEPGVSPAGFEAKSDSPWVESEQKRRTFWVAYCLDRCASLHGTCPLTFHEDAISTRLPVSETDFENSRAVRTEFLSEAIAVGSQGVSSTFSECAIFLTLWGRSVAHQSRMPTDSTYRDDSLELCAQYECLNDVVEIRRHQLQQYSYAAGVLADPMLVFTCLIATVVVIHLMDVRLRTKTLPAAQHQALAASYGKQTAAAVEEMITLAQSLNQPSQFKTHPFVPSMLFHAVRIQLDRKPGVVTGTDTSGTSNKLLYTLQNLGTVNQLARDVLQKLERDGLSTPQRISGVGLDAPHNNNDDVLH